MILHLVSWLSLAAGIGCTKLPYEYFPQSEPPGEFQSCRCGQIERGTPNRFFDGLGHYFFSLPSKLVLWNWQVENHDVSCDTEIALREFIAANNLDDVKVRINEYSPGDEWDRLTSNERVGAGWRYTLGAISWLFYTVFPQRVFGGDNFNPFTNTINLYSDIPAVALHEAGHAKDFAESDHPGSYAALAFIPLSSLWFEKEATSDALSYLENKGEMCGKKDAYKILYPAYGTYIGGETVQLISIFSPIDTLFSLAAVIPGHIVGRYQASKIECAEPADDTPPS